MRNNKEEFNKSKELINLSNFKKLRTAKGYSQVKLEHLVGVSNSSIEAYEQNQRIPSLPVAYRLADVLGCSIDYLVGRVNELENYYKLSKTEQQKVVEYINELLKSAEEK